jgi:hypothetical protein
MRLRMLAAAFLAAVSLNAAPLVAAAEFTETAMVSCEASSSAATGDGLAALPLAAKPGPEPDATCTAVCHNGSTVSCTASSCSAVNASCPSQRGSVTCGATTTYCPACPSAGCVGVPACTTTYKCSITYCGGEGMGVCVSGCCYCI